MTVIINRSSGVYGAFACILYEALMLGHQTFIHVLGRLVVIFVVIVIVINCNSYRKLSEH